MQLCLQILEQTSSLGDPHPGRTTDVASLFRDHRRLRKDRSEAIESTLSSGEDDVTKEDGVLPALRESSREGGSPLPRSRPMHRPLTPEALFLLNPASGLLGVDLAFLCESGNLCWCPPLTLQHLSSCPTTWLHLATKTGFWPLGEKQKSVWKSK